MAWIRENILLFWPLAQRGYKAVGRGAIVVDATVTITHPGGVGHPSGYIEQQVIEEMGNEDSQRLVREYQPEKEFITTLLKPQDRVSSYRIRVIPKAVRENLNSQVKPGHGKSGAETPPEPPDQETLMEWEAEGGCEATDGCWVEPDGTCPHGQPSWLLKLGLI